jgi:hypothetical protein
MWWGYLRTTATHCAHTGDWSRARNTVLAVNKNLTGWKDCMAVCVCVCVALQAVNTLLEVAYCAPYSTLTAGKASHTHTDTHTHIDRHTHTHTHTLEQKHSGMR